MAVIDLMNQTITLYPRSGYDKWGKLSLGAGTNYKARVQEGTKNEFLPTGQVVNIVITAYVAPDVSVEVNDKVTYSSVDYKVYKKYVTVDGSGDANHIKLELIKWQE